ncbi:Fatty acid-binding protein, brain [Armadillidium nasatum]|uniref:Fatty acid-binding protein, brain n=1 Tax=Armadillidium nasatum TaxID=96803 RepID=A0A5N5T512_9CRUS|nr:Fatty acid-binding protein, brain [Armadillidium nasatum]
MSHHFQSFDLEYEECLHLPIVDFVIYFQLTLNAFQITGVGLVTRKLANATSPTIIFTEKDGVYNMKTVSTVKSYDISFKIGVEFDELASDGRKCKFRVRLVLLIGFSFIISMRSCHVTTFTKDGDNKLIQVQKAEKGKDAKYVREFHRHTDWNSRYVFT